MSKRVFILLIAVCAARFANAQYDIPEHHPLNDSEQKEYLNNHGQYIFEGTVLETNRFRLPNDPKTIYCTTLIKIHKVFKGDLQCGTVELVNKSAFIPGDTFKIDAVQKRQRMQPLYRYEYFTKGQTATWFANKRNWSESLFGIARRDNTFFLTANEVALYDTMAPENASVSFYDANINYKNFAAFYENVKSAVQKDYLSCDHFDAQKTMDSIRNHLLRWQQAHPYHRAPQKPLTPEQKRRNDSLINLHDRQFPRHGKTGYHRPIQLNKLGAATISFTIENPTQNNNFFEFDIYAESDRNTYFDGTGLQVLFNPAAFGTYLTGSGTITVSRGTILHDSVNYANPYTYDVSGTSDSVGIVCGTYYYLDTPSRYLLTTTPEQLCHVKIKIANCGQSAGLGFNTDTFYTNYSTYYSDSMAGAKANMLNYMVVDSSVNQDYTCTPVISSVYSTSSSLRGGTGDQVDIIGKGFGNTQGYLYMRNANNGFNNSYSMQLDNSDIDIWSDTLIVFTLPSIVGIFTPYPTPGAGKIELKNSLYLTAFSPDSLDIEYSANNEFIPGYNVKRQTHFIDMNGKGGYTIRVQDSIASDTALLSCIKAAVKKWNCASNINWEVGNDTSLNVGQQDNICLIHYKHLPNTTAMSTVTWTDTCRTASDFNVYVTDFDIAINRLYKTYFQKGVGYLPLNSGKVDFYAVILHELGHAQQLMHLNDLNSVMFYYSPLGPVSAANRMLTLHWNDVSGASDVFINSKSIPLTGNCGSLSATTDLIGNYCTTTPPKFTISGISISSLCGDLSSVKPKLTPNIVGGVPPFSYHWTPQSGNQVGLSSRTVAQPTIDSVYGSNPYTVSYLLTVVDNSRQPQTASATIDVTLDATRGYDYAMRDAHDDTYKEPNYTSQTVYFSPDLWNRIDSDGIKTHQTAHYKGRHDSNYVYCRIHNIGCLSGPSHTSYLRLYWTWAALGEKWHYDWKYARIKNTVTGIDTIGGKEITDSNKIWDFPLPPIAAGDSFILRHGWIAPRPQDFDTVNGVNFLTANVCLLARIETDNGHPNFGMTYQEYFQPPRVPSGDTIKPNSTYRNVQRSNDIVTKNMWVENLSGQYLVGKKVGILGLNSGVMNLNFHPTSPYSYGSFQQVGHIKVKLGADIYNRWVAAGALGTGIVADPGNYAVEIVDPTGGWITNIPTDSTLDPQFMYVYFYLNPGTPIVPASYYFTLTDYIDPLDPASIIGSVGFQENITTDSIPPLPPISGATPLCVGSTASYTNSFLGGVWRSDNSFVATVATDGAVTGVHPGSCTIIYTYTNSYDHSASVSKNLVVDSLPIVPAFADTFTFCMADHPILGDAVTGGTWASSNPAIAIIDNSTGTLSGINPGTTPITYTVTNDCGSTTVSDAVTVSACWNLTYANVNVYPNPTSGIFTLSTYFPIVRTATITIKDIYGTTIVSPAPETVSGTYARTYDLSSYAGGTYIVTITDGYSIVSKELILIPPPPPD